MGSIEFKGIYKSFGDKHVLRGVDLTVKPGEVMFIIGQSGAGKSVLVKHLVGLLRPDRGRVYLDGVDVTDFTEKEFYPIRKRCAMVFQNSTLFDSMTLVENVMLPIRKHRKVTDEEAHSQAMEQLQKVGMQRYADRYPADFGDGMRKKVAIARALTLDPEYVIFDEPTTGIDPISAAMVDKLIRHLADNLGVTSIVISHDLRSIFGIADRVAMLYKGELAEDGTPEDFKKSTNPVVQQFIHGRPEGPMEEPN
ncbi:ABC transporter ATP-binding protein [Persicimonas caeni]|uniref:ABC transporter ATP-binding protein n=1 Tax=Persicimonas caeni TaxID=2292766 RepID=A0A4Y6Q2F2_PERCE|nr:ABC transporter ATP-binding protein [Persicimonas caeni]QDG54733.1 ABC transporter ATP-binding protein [Persicimonas caeni]QED35954.1 ABC transporter ATP-binding protein [Persicimonas caeni]